MIAGPLANALALEPYRRSGSCCWVLQEAG